MVGWWPGEGNALDISGSNNPSAVNGINGVSFVAAQVGDGFSFSPSGYIDIPPSLALANQQFTWAGWVNPKGPGANNDSFGSVILGQERDSTHAVVEITWRAIDDHFIFLFGDISSELIVSTDAFPPGQFYFVAGSYDGLTFRLFVNGNSEGQLTLPKTISYSSLTWTIGADASVFRDLGFARTWNGIIDEVQAYSRALTIAEMQAISVAGSAGICKSLSLGHIWPTEGGNSGPVTTSLYGVDFQVGAKVKLTASGRADIVGQNTTVLYSNVIVTTFLPSDAPVGVRDVVVTNPDGSEATLAGSFSLELGGAPDIWVDFIGRGQVRDGLEASSYAVIGNHGNVDQYDVTLWLTAPSTVRLDLGCSEPTSEQLGLPHDSDLGACNVPSSINNGVTTDTPVWLYRIPAGGTIYLPVSLSLLSPPGPPHSHFQIHIQAYSADSQFARIGSVNLLDESPIEQSVVNAALAVVSLEPSSPAILAGNRQFGQKSRTERAHDGTVSTSASPSQEDLQRDAKTVANFLINFCGSGGRSCGPAPFGKLGQFLDDLLETAGVAKALGGIYDTELGLAVGALNNALKSILPHLAQIQAAYDADREYIAPGDPNDKLGSSGIGLPRFVSAKDPLLYTIYFDNVPTASAPAQKVIVRDQLDSTVVDMIDVVTRTDYFHK